MGYFDTLKNFNDRKRLQNASSNKIPLDIGEKDEKAELLRLARQNIDPLDIKTDLLPEDYKPKVPKHIIQRNLEKQAKLMNQKKKIYISRSKDDGNSLMKRDESDIVKQRLKDKFETKKRQQLKGKLSAVNKVEVKEAEKKLSFKEMMKLAEVNKATLKAVESKAEAAKKVSKHVPSRKAAVKRLQHPAKMKAVPKPHVNTKKYDSFSENEQNYKPSGFDLLMEEELQSEELARKEDLKEARLLKKKQLEKQNLRKK